MRLNGWITKGLAVLMVLVFGVAAGFGPEREPSVPVPPIQGSGIPAPVQDFVTPLVAEPAFEPVDPAQVGLDRAQLAEAEKAIRREVRRGAFPGAALVVGRVGQVATMRGIGSLDGSGARVVPASTLYDLASLTKVVATTTAVMLLVEDGRMELDAPVARYLPYFFGGAKNRVTVRHLLTHTSGLPARTRIRGSKPQERLRRVIATPLARSPGERVVYSDVGPVILWAAAERAAGEPLEGLLRRRIFGPLGMTSTRFRPELPCRACAPTTRDIRGQVHDLIARKLGGVAGNAGLFSTATDLGRFAAMLAGGGELGGVRVLKEETIRTFARRQPGTGTRALGWDTPNPQGYGAGGRRISPRAFGHTGFTGTSLWVDPDRGTWTVLLTNRTYRPRGRNRIQALRRTVHDRVSEAVDRAAAE